MYIKDQIISSNIMRQGGHISIKFRQLSNLPKKKLEAKDIIKIASKKPMNSLFKII